MYRNTLYIPTRILLSEIDTQFLTEIIASDAARMALNSISDFSKSFQQEKED